MSHVLKLRSGNTELHNAFVGSQAELTVDTERNVLVLHDGIRIGGIPQARENLGSTPVKNADGERIALGEEDIGRDFKLRWNGQGFDIVPLEA